MKNITAYLDLLRAHFIPAWILIFTAGYITATNIYGGFSWPDLVKIVFIAVFGFEAGMVLNDYVDKDLDKKDVDVSLTKYFRPFKTRPLATGKLRPIIAVCTFIIFTLVTAVLICTFPPPHCYYALAIMVYAYLVEYFYQVKKRQQKLPLAQLVGRTDFALFPVAAYLLAGEFDMNALAYFFYFYPLAQAHLAINDLADFKNDQVRGLQTVPIMYGVKGTIRWIIIFTLIHLFSATIFIQMTNPRATVWFIVSFLVVGLAVFKIARHQTSSAALKFLPLFHLTMAIQSLALIFSS